MEIRVDDYGFAITFTVKKADGTVQDLTGYTSAKLQVATIGTYRNVLNADAVISDASNGEVTYTVQADDFNTVGNYIGCIKLEKDGIILTTRDFNINVVQKLNP